MSRRRRAPKRKLLPDPKFGSLLVTRFVNGIMERGKRSIAERIFYDAMDIVKAKTNEQDVLKVFTKAVENVKPILEVKSRRVGGATYQVPVDVPQERRIALASRWILAYSRARKGIPMVERLAAEVLDAYKGTGASIKKREDTHKMADANRAFAHYKW